MYVDRIQSDIYSCRNYFFVFSCAIEFDIECITLICGIFYKNGYIKVTNMSIRKNSVAFIIRTLLLLLIFYVYQFFANFKNYKSLKNGRTIPLIKNKTPLLKFQPLN